MAKSTAISPAIITAMEMANRRIILRLTFSIAGSSGFSGSSSNAALLMGFLCLRLKCPPLIAKP